MKREQVGVTEMYKGSSYHFEYCGPDLLVFVDKLELPNFYVNMEAARTACKRYIDEKIKAGR